MTGYGKLGITAASFALIIAPAAAQTAGSPKDGKSQRVTISDLDLASVKGQRIMALRIARAAQTLCDQVNERFGASVRKEQRNCRAETISAAMIAVHDRAGTQVANR
jgi:UrcA family protein